MEGRMMEAPFEILYRNPKFPLRVNDEFQLSGLTAKVLAVDEIGPTRVEFKFDRSLDDPSIYFLGWTSGRLERIQMPSIGESLILRWVPIL
jgi:hypothetical protein